MEAPHCKVCLVYPGHDIPTHIDALKAEIQAAMDEGWMPVTVRSFNELHDHCDANMFDALGGSIEVGDTDDDSPEGQQLVQDLADTFNLITDAIGDWLMTRPMGGEVTPMARAKAAAAFICNHYPLWQAAAGERDGVPIVFIEAKYSASFTSLAVLPDGWAKYEADGPILRHGSESSRPVGPNDVAEACWAIMRTMSGAQYAKAEVA